MTEREVLKLALEALESHVVWFSHDTMIGKAMRNKADKAITAIKEVLAGAESKRQPERSDDRERSDREQEPVATMPSNTRYTVEVEGHGQTYWDNIHDAITNAQRAVYSGPDNTTRALDDLKAGRIAEWSYGFSAVRIYPPQNTTPPKRTWVSLTDEDKQIAFDDTQEGGGFWEFADAIEAKLKEKNT